MCHSPAVSQRFPKTTAQNFGVFGTDTISGFENIAGGGGDRLYGTTGANLILGLSGNDLLDGRSGNDTLNAGAGSDICVGGAGADLLIGGLEGLFLEPAARDTFRYNAVSDSGLTAMTWDTIRLFDKGTLATDDRIDLSAIDANPLLAGNQAFVFRGAGAFTATRGEARLVVSGADTLVYVDNDTDAAAEMILKVEGVTGLTAADFIL